MRTLWIMIISLGVSACCTHTNAMKRAERAAARQDVFVREAKHDETRALAKSNKKTFQVIAFELGGKDPEEEE